MNGFETVRTEELPLIQATAHEFVHDTGAKLIHFACEDEDNSFAAIMPTVPTDETGAPHILEHCVLNGSKRYPDARSLGAIHATGGGAWTGWEYTWYFHSSPVHADYLKLVDLRCDSLFEPLLAHETFLHQAHHLGFTEPENTESPLIYRGVIYNEQKGILGHPIAVSWQEICRALFPAGHPYALEHGGTPRDVPTITYEQLKAFHQRHYHPANAHFLSWGDVPLDDLLTQMDEALSRVPQRPFTPTSFPSVGQLDAPVRRVGKLPIGSGDDPTGRGSVLMAWIGADCTDPYESLLHDLLVEILSGTPTSPLRAALASSGLGSSVSQTYDKFGIRYVRHITACGLDGCEANDADALEALVMDTLRGVLDAGIDDETIDVALNGLEFKRRTLSNAAGDGDGPTSFFIQHVNTPWLAGGDPLAGARMDEQIARFESERASKPLEDRLRAWYIDNPFRATVVIEPDPGADVRLEEEERRTLDGIAASLGDDAKREIVEQERRLNAFLEGRAQPAAAPDAAKLKSGIKEPPEPLRLEAAGTAVEAFPVRTNGITHVDLVADLGGLDDDLWDYVHLFAAAVGGAGAAGRTPAQTAAIVGTATGGISADVLVPVTGTGDTHLRLLRFGGRALERRQDELVELLASLWSTATFTPDLLRAVIDGSLSRAHQWVLIDAPGILRRLAGSRVRTSWELRSRVDGFARLAHLRSLSSADDAALEEVAVKLTAIRDHVAQRGLMDVFVAASGKEAIDGLLPALETHLGSLPDGGSRPGSLNDIVTDPITHETRVIGQPTAFNCEVWSVPTRVHPDGPAIAVAGVLAARHVRGEVTRKGTAYSAAVDAYSDPGSITAWSIRDPNIAKTYGAFEGAFTQLANEPVDLDTFAMAKLEASVLTDMSSKPHERARTAFVRNRTGLDAEVQRAYGERLEALTPSEVQRAVSEHIGTGARASLTSAEMAAKAADEGYGFDLSAES